MARNPPGRAVWSSPFCKRWVSCVSQVVANVRIAERYARGLVNGQAVLHFLDARPQSFQPCTSTHDPPFSTKSVHLSCKTMSRVQAELLQSRSMANVSTTLARRLHSTSSAPHICIIGAGMAGLRCAEILIKEGMKVTILEGRRRIGGRIHQSNHAGHLVDLGPNWIHGTEDNPIMELARDTASTVCSLGERHNVFDDKGNLMDDVSATACSDALWKIVTDASKYSNQHSEYISPHVSLYDFIKDRLMKEHDLTEAEREELLTPPEVVNGPQRAVPRAAVRNECQEKAIHVQRVLWMAEFWGSFVGSPTKKQSLKYLWLEECIGGENLFLASTYKAILNRVASIPLKAAEIKLGTTANRIISPMTENEGGKVLVQSVDGFEDEFDEVVLTAPLGWIKRNGSCFTPPLPSDLSDAINAISYGQLEKVYVTFPSSFWLSQVCTGEVPAGRSPTVFDGQLQDSQDITESKDSSIWLHPAYASITKPRAYGQNAVDLSALDPALSHPTLLFYIHGASSAHVASITSSYPASERQGLLEAFFEPYYSRLPNYSPDSADCRPVHILATEWSNDELAGFGSYSNFQIGLEDAERHIERMREGMPDRRVWLAGEHTSPFVALGTVTGAYWSGEAVAQRISGLYKRNRA